MPCEVTLMLFHCIRNQSCRDGSWLVDLRSTLRQKCNAWKHCQRGCPFPLKCSLASFDTHHADITVPVIGKLLTGRCSICLPIHHSLCSLAVLLYCDLPVCACACVQMHWSCIRNQTHCLPPPHWMTTVAVNAALCPRIPPLRHTASTMRTVLNNVDCFVFHLYFSMQM